MQQSSSSSCWQRQLNNRQFLVSLSAALWAVVALLFLAPLSAQGAAKEPQYNVKLGARSLFDGNFKYGDWLPVEITLENYGEALDVRVETIINSFYNGTNLNTAFRREVSLGQRANKRFTLYIQPFVQTSNVSRSVSYEAKVLLKTGNAQLDEKVIKLQPIDPKDYFVGAVVSDPNSLAGLNNLKVGPLPSRVTAAPLTLADIPDRVEGLRSLNALIISENATDNLSGAQRTALKTWVSTGGQLMLMGGNGWGRVREAFDSSFLPFDVLDFTNITDVSNLLPVPGERATLSRSVAMARGQVLQGAQALSYGPVISGTSNPMLIERRVGGGRVLVSAIDLMAVPVLEWSGSNRVWQKLFSFNAGGYNALYAETNPQLKNGVDYLSFISSVPELQLPDLLPFLLIFGIFILVVSPLNFVVLQRMGRLEWAWITIPASIAICTAITLYFTNSQPPGEVIINQMSIIQASPGQENAQVRSYAAIFSPEDRRYQVAPEAQEGMGASLLLPLNRATTSSSSGPDSDINRVVVQGDRSRMDGFPIGQWGAQGFSTEGTLPARPFQMSSALSFQRDSNQPDNAKVVGTIRNTTSTTIRNAILVLGDLPYKLKEVIEPGEAVTVDFAMTAPTAAAPAYCSTSYGNYGSFPPQTAGDRIANTLRQDRDRREDRLLANRAGFLKKMYDSGRYSPLDPSRGIDFVGWLDDNPLPLNVDDVTVQSKANQVLVSRLPVSYETREGEGRFFIPGTYLWPESSANEAGVSPLTSRTDRLDEICVGKGSVISQYRLPVERGNLRVNRLTLYFNSMTASSQRNPNLPDRIELYDWQAGKWQILSGLTNSAVPVSGSGFNVPPPRPNDIPNAARYVEAQTGRLLLRFSHDNNPGLITQFSLSVEGTQ